MFPDLQKIPMIVVTPIFIGWNKFDKPWYQHLGIVLFFTESKRLAYDERYLGISFRNGPSFDT